MSGGGNRAACLIAKERSRPTEDFVGSCGVPSLFV